MKTTNKQMIFLAAIVMGAVFFWGFGLTSSKDITYATASLLIVPTEIENNIVSAKIVLANQAVKSSMHLSIPSINVDAKIDPMGVTKDGAMESPAGAQNVGWFSFGPRPGEVGSAVLAGHYGRWKNGDVSVFDNLHTLKPGDKIHVQNENGAIATFVVRELRVYDKNDDASLVFASNDSASHLNIIACAGVYDEALKTYSDRLVVFADKQ